MPIGFWNPVRDKFWKDTEQRPGLEREALLMEVDAFRKNNYPSGAAALITQLDFRSWLEVDAGGPVRAIHIEAIGCIVQIAIG